MKNEEKMPFFLFFFPGSQFRGLAPTSGDGKSEKQAQKERKIQTET